jgi:PAS domain S-box-containing protein
MSELARHIENKAASDQTQKRVEEISAIYEISQALNSVPIDDLLSLITEKAAAVMDAHACSLMLKDPRRNELVIKASYGLDEQIVESTRVAYGEGIVGRVAASGEPMLLTNLSEDPRFAYSEVVPRPEIVSSICVPLRDTEGRVQGVLSIHRRYPAPLFTEDDVKVFSVFASQAAQAVSNAHLYASLNEKVQELSTLYEASREMSCAYSLEDVSNVLVKVAADLTGVPAILILLDGKGRCNVQSTFGIPEWLRDELANIKDAETAAWIRGLRNHFSFSPTGKRRWPTRMQRLVSVLGKTFCWVTMLPLLAEDDVIGSLVLCDSEGRRPEQSRVRLLSIIIAQAATIIKNASRREEQIGQKLLEISALCELSERISTAGSLQEALDSILEIVSDLVWYDESFIATADYERNVLVIQAYRGKSGQDLRGSEILISEDDLSSIAIRERKALLSADISEDARFQSTLTQLSHKGVRSFMAIPLTVHDEVVGVLNVHALAPNLYTEDNVRILSVIASQAAALYKELEALSALTTYTDNILRSIAAGVLTLDKDGKILTWNKAAEDIVGIPAEAVIGRHFSKVVQDLEVTDTDKQRLLSLVKNVFETGEKYLGYKKEFHTKDKDVRYINMNISQLRDHTGEVLGVVMIFEDVTKGVQLEAEMRRISELAAIGQLAASIAHELRNPLSSIKGAAQYLRNEYSDHKAICEFLDIIVDEVNALNKVTTEFLDFARPAKLTLRETDINDILFRTVQFMQLEISKQHVSVEQHFAYDLPRIMVDEKQIEQVFRNLILNSIQAMPNGGKLTISTHAAGDGVNIKVSDTGIGIPEDQLEQIFVPFFTTKTKGTGLGLSIVQKIIDNHGGRIRVESKVGEGTTFEIFLPVCSARAQAAIIQAEGAEERGEADLFRRAHP